MVAWGCKARNSLFFLLILTITASCTSKAGVLVGETITAPFRILTLQTPYPNQIAEIKIDTAQSRAKEWQGIIDSNNLDKILSYVNKNSDWTINWNCNDRGLTREVRSRCITSRNNYSQFISRIEIFQKFDRAVSTVVKSKSSTEMIELLEFVYNSKKDDQELFVPFLLKEPFKDLIKSAYRDQGDSLKSIGLFPDVAKEVQSADFNEARKKDSIGDYEAFLRKYNNTSFNPEISVRLDTLLCQKSLQEKALKTYRYYLSQHPSGKCASEIMALMEPLLCADSEDTDKLEDYQLYSTLYPNSPCVKRIAARIEPQVWSMAVAQNTQSSYGQYIEMFPNGQNSAVARDYMTIMGAIVQLSSKDEQGVAAASQKLSTMGSKLNAQHVSLIADVMKSGTNNWSKAIGRTGHCTWYQDTSARHYAAKVLAQASSPHINVQMRADAKDVANKSVTKRKVTDPGWV